MTTLAGQTVLVTGAAGFLGRHVARRFAAEGAAVIGLGHGGFGNDGPQAWGIVEWRAAGVGMSELTALEKAPDIIAHCAGGSLVGRSFDAPREDFERTVVATSDVLEYMRVRAPEARLIYPSSAAIYGEALALPIAVASAANPVSPYGVHKLAAENLCRSYARHFGIRSVILRLFSLYGPGLRKQLLWDACRRLDAGFTTFGGAGDELRDWIYADDAAALFVAAEKVASAACPVANGGTGIGTSVRAIVGQLARSIAPAIEPGFVGGGRAGDPKAYVADIAEARAWGWRPSIAWEGGVEAYVRWYRDHAAMASERNPFAAGKASE